MVPSGLLLIDKPIGCTSHDVVATVRRCLGIKRVGHTGTLDPLASGLLPCLIGEATKFSQYLSALDKSYAVKAKFGSQTDTGDSTGKVVAEGEWKAISFAQVNAALESLTGTQQQAVPKFSALKYQGRPRYEYAREGIAIPGLERAITIFSISEIRYNAGIASFNVHCSKGTYIRTLVEALGQCVGCPAHLVELRRLACGEFKVVDSVSATLLSADLAPSSFLSLANLFPHLTAIVLTPAQAIRIQQGQGVHVQTEPSQAQTVVLVAEDTFLGLGSTDTCGRVKPLRLIKTKT